MSEYSLQHQAVAKSLYDAFQNEPFYLAIAQVRDNQEESEQDALLKYFDFSISEGKQYGDCHTLDNPSVGASIWLKPQSKKISQQQSKAKKAFLKNQFGEKSLAIYEKMAALMNIHETNIIRPNYWYLSILGVSKNYQGLGYGRKLLTPVLSESDQLGIPTFLETFTEGNLVFYGKLGYKVVADYVDPYLKKTCWILVREVR